MLRTKLMPLLIPALAGCYHPGEADYLGFAFPNFGDFLAEFRSGDQLLLGTRLCPEIGEVRLEDGTHQVLVSGSDSEEFRACFDELLSGPASLDADGCLAFEGVGEVTWELTPNSCGDLAERMRFMLVEPTPDLKLGIDEWRLRWLQDPTFEAQLIGLSPGRSIADLQESPSQPRHVLAGQLDVPVMRFDNANGRMYWMSEDIEFELIGEGIEPYVPSDTTTFEDWQPVVKPIAAPRAGIFVQGAKPERSCIGHTASSGDKALGEKTKRGVVRGFTTGCWAKGGALPLRMSPGSSGHVRATLAGGQVYESPELIAVTMDAAVSLDVVAIENYLFADVRDAEGHLIHGAPIEWSLDEGALAITPGSIDTEIHTAEYAHYSDGHCEAPPSTEPELRQAVVRARLGELEDTVEIEYQVEPPEGDVSLGPERRCAGTRNPRRTNPRRTAAHVRRTSTPPLRRCSWPWACSRCCDGAEHQLFETAEQHSIPRCARHEASGLEILPTRAGYEASGLEVLPTRVKHEASGLEILPTRAGYETAGLEILPTRVKHEASGLEILPTLATHETAGLEVLPRCADHETVGLDVECRGGRPRGYLARHDRWRAADAR